jgi:large subunit ribosomal protein L30
LLPEGKVLPIIKAKEGQTVGKMLKITLIHSYIGRPEAQRRVLRGMGLGKVNRSVVLKDTPEIRGMIRKVDHLVAAVEVEGNGK